MLRHLHFRFASPSPFVTVKQCQRVPQIGTTGKPKGVDVTHGNVTNLVCNYPGNLGIGPGTRVGHLLNVSFDMGKYTAISLFPRSKGLTAVCHYARRRPSILAPLHPCYIKLTKLSRLGGFRLSVQRRDARYPRSRMGARSPRSMFSPPPRCQSKALTSARKQIGRAHV